MATRIKTDGARAAIKRITGPEMVRGIGRALYTAADMIKVEAQISLTTNAASGAKHVVSTPGEAPNNDTAVLANNIEAVLAEPLKATVTSNAPYAAALEYGTSRMAERPYMRPAALKMEREIATMFKVVVGQVVRGGAARTKAEAVDINEYRKNRPGGVKGRD